MASEKTRTATAAVRATNSLQKIDHQRLLPHLALQGANPFFPRRRRRGGPVLPRRPPRPPPRAFQSHPPVLSVGIPPAVKHLPLHLHLAAQRRHRFPCHHPLHYTQFELRRVTPRLSTPCFVCLLCTLQGTPPSHSLNCVPILPVSVLGCSPLPVPIPPISAIRLFSNVNLPPNSLNRAASWRIFLTQHKTGHRRR